jgi:hypothetical protein
LTRFPDQRVSVAVLCNAGAASRNAEMAHAVADLYLERHLKPVTPMASRRLPSAEMAAIVGRYFDRTTGEFLDITRSGDALSFVVDPYQAGEAFALRGPLASQGGSRFVSANGQVAFEIAGDIVRKTAPNGTLDRFDRVTAVTPSAAQLATLTGRYASDEAEVAVEVAVQGEALVIKRRPETVITLTPIFEDAFRGSIGLVRFHRDATGAVKEMSISQPRVWDLRFRREERSATR